MASAEGDCYKQEDLNDRDEYLSDDIMENMQKSSQSYPFNNYNRNVEKVYQMQNLE